jgi:hypothetical protein
MGKTSNASKQRWNSARYTQLKASLPKCAVEAFREACAAKGVSMAGELARLIGAEAPAPPPSAPANARLGTRGKRRKALQALEASLCEIRDAECAYMERIPENLTGSSRYENAESCVDALNEAIDLLHGAYLP